MRGTREKNNGITLIALVITIIILLILAGISILTLTGENGIVKRAKQAKQTSIETEMKEQLILAIYNLQVEKGGDATLDDITQEWINNEIKNYKCTVKDGVSEGETVLNKEITMEKNEIICDFYIDQKLNIIQIKGSQGGLLSIIEKNNLSTGTYKISVSDEIYNLKLYNIEGSLELNEDTTFGEEEDVGKSDAYAQNMIVVKVNGNLTINEGVTLTSYASSDGYGGPKGMMIYCTGTITNNGTISMTARGAYAEGQNVYLWKNADGSYEYVPKVGASGGSGYPSYIYNGNDQACYGKQGDAAEGRQTGGGGSGGGYGWQRLWWFNTIRKRNSRNILFRWNRRRCF